MTLTDAVPKSAISPYQMHGQECHSWVGVILLCSCNLVDKEPDRAHAWYPNVLSAMKSDGEIQMKRGLKWEMETGMSLYREPRHPGHKQEQ